MINLDKNELIEIGVQFGSPVRWRHPKMRPYIYKEIGKSILDLKKIIANCQNLNSYLQSLIEKDKTILFLATKKSTREIIKEVATRCGMPYIVNKWKGGFLTNFSEMKRKIKELHGLNNFLLGNNFKNLAKKDQVNFEKKRNKLQSIYEGVANLHRQPDALFIIGLNKEKTAFKEAKKSKIPVIAICNADCNPSLVDYVIPGNDEGIKSITFFANLTADTIIEIKKGEKQKSIEKEENNNK